ncbi:hypothetical protein ACQEVF_06830 [Nonomuraea polychroma]|uniref:hypothetical protein n=1 Tax=Nonomuraea polychroma TaxID=46176 RepID=UPI003D8A750A
MLIPMDTLPLRITKFDGRRNSYSAAERLRAELETWGISADVHEGYRLALAWVWVDLVVWCDVERFWWRTGWDEERKRAIYAWHPVADLGRAVRRIAFRYAELREGHPLSASVRAALKEEPDRRPAWPL